MSIFNLGSIINIKWFFLWIHYEFSYFTFMEFLCTLDKPSFLSMLWWENWRGVSIIHCYSPIWFDGPHILKNLSMVHVTHLFFQYVRFIFLCNGLMVNLTFFLYGLRSWTPQVYDLIIVWVISYATITANPNWFLNSSKVR